MTESETRTRTHRAKEQGGTLPFLKWAGGKRKLISQYEPFFPSRIARYFEPFLGGGAVFFHLAPKTAFLSDSNDALVALYRVVKDDVDRLIAKLKEHKNEEAYYYRVRALSPDTLSPVERAARFVYLNKTCYNGLYRVNSKNEFNVPFGKYKKPRICDEERLRSASALLANATLTVSDFADAVEPAKKGDFVYFDPPYAPLTKTANFTSYTDKGFGEEEQVRLAETVARLAKKNVSVMVSNSDTPRIRDLYRAFRIVEVQAARAINSKGNGRGKVTELLVIT